MGRICCVVDRDCEAPANCPSDTHIPKCFACGEDVCWHCSIRLPYMTYGVRRICLGCVSDLDRVNGERVRRLHAEFMEKRPTKKEMRDWRPKLYVQQPYELQHRIIPKARHPSRRRTA